MKLSIAHALAQSTLLARYETTAQRVLSSQLTVSIPRQLAENGALRLRRHEALKLTGRLFKLRRDVNLISNVLDIPELFWTEASLKALYDAVREYMEIRPRVQVLNEKLNVANDFVSFLFTCKIYHFKCTTLQLDAIHDHLNNNAMERITWIVIWYKLVILLFFLNLKIDIYFRLIAVAILVELVSFALPLQSHAFDISYPGGNHSSTCFPRGLKPRGIKNNRNEDNITVYKKSCFTRAVKITTISFLLFFGNVSS